MRIALAALIATLTAPSAAFAFQQTVTCDPSGMYACAEGESPKPVRWPIRCVVYYINEEGSAKLADKDATFDAIRASFDAWTNIEGGEFSIEFAGMTNEDRAEHVSDRGTEGNANIVVFRDDDWPYSSRTALALTSVTFSPSDGYIADADVEFNTQYNEFTVGDAAVEVDLQNTLTHEAGHFLGLDHSADGSATMYRSAPRAETQKRSLEQDDIDGYFAVYPKQGTNVQCADMPTFFEKPKGKPKKGCCATTTAAPAPTPLLIGLVLLVVYRRRKSDEVVKG